MSLSQLLRVRWAVRVVLALGVAASLAANILHARPNPISQTIAAWPPLALLFTVELISRVPVHRRGMAALRLAATATIAGIAAWVSYWHMVGVAARYGEVGATPYLMPFSVDGLVIVASVCLVELGGRIRGPQPAPETTSAPVQEPGADVTVSEPPTIPDRERAAKAPEEVKAAACETFRTSVRKGQPLTGQQIGSMYGYSDRWGRERIAEVKRADAAPRRRLVAIGGHAPGESSG